MNLFNLCLSFCTLSFSFALAVEKSVNCDLAERLLGDHGWMFDPNR